MYIIILFNAYPVPDLRGMKVGILDSGAFDRYRVL